MKKYLTIIAIVLLAVVSCGKFEPGGTSIQNLSGEWVCTIYADGGAGFVSVDAFYYDPGMRNLIICNTSDNKNEIWLNDMDQEFMEGDLNLKCKVEADDNAMTFGKLGEIYEDITGAGRMVWGGKVTPNAVNAPGSGSLTDKIEFFIAFEEDDADGNPATAEPYCCVYYVAGYRFPGFKADLGPAPELARIIKDDWDVPAEVPDITEYIPAAPAPAAP